MKKLYFVVPHTIFDEFEKQNFKKDVNQKGVTVGSTGENSLNKRPLEEVNNTDNNKEQEVAKTKNNKIVDKDFIQQYVICIPVDPRIDLSKLKEKREELLASSVGKPSQVEAS